MAATQSVLSTDPSTGSGFEVPVGTVTAPVMVGRCRLPATEAPWYPNGRDRWPGPGPRGPITHPGTYRSPLEPLITEIVVSPLVAGPRITSPVLASNSDPWQGQAMIRADR